MKLTCPRVLAGGHRVGTEFALMTGRRKDLYCMGSCAALRSRSLTGHKIACDGIGVNWTRLTESHSAHPMQGSLAPKFFAVNIVSGCSGFSLEHQSARVVNQKPRERMCIPPSARLPFISVAVLALLGMSKSNRAP